MFITDTVDAIYRPDDWLPEALLDRLAEVVGDLPAAEVRTDCVITRPLGTDSNPDLGTGDNQTQSTWRNFLHTKWRFSERWPKADVECSSTD